MPRMALRATVYKAELSLADMDRGVYGDFSLTLARHPSETEERLMVRLAAFALWADAALAFGRGLSTEDEPDLWQHDATGVLQRWIDVGLPDERRIRKACGRAEQVAVLAYGERKCAAWWAQAAPLLARHDNLTVLLLPDADAAALTRLAARSMSLTCTVQDGRLDWHAADGNATLHPRRLWPEAG